MVVYIELSSFHSVTSLLSSKSQKPSPTSSGVQSSAVVACRLASSAKETGVHVLEQQSPGG